MSPNQDGQMFRRASIRIASLCFAASPLAAQTATPAAAPAAAAVAAPAKLTPDEEAHFLDLGKTYTRWFLAGKADSMITAFTAESVEKMGGIDGLRNMMNQVAERAGVETKIVEEKLTRRNGRIQFWHAGLFSEFADDQLVLRWILDADGKISGAGAGPKAQTPAPDPS